MAAVGRIGRAIRRVGGASSTAADTHAEGSKAIPAAVPTPAKKAAAAAKEVPAKKVAPATAASKAAPAKTTSAKAQPAKKSAPVKAAAPATKAPATKAPAPATKAPVTKTPAAKAPVAASAGSAEWTRAELAQARKELQAELSAMQIAYERSLRDLDELQRSSTDGAGDDQADAGSKTFEREQEQSIAANRLDLLTQIQRSIERIDAGTYGLCESCGKPIPKARLKAFPAATLDVACKQREERR